MRSKGRVKPIMPIHIFTIEKTVITDEGLRLLPGVSISDKRPEVSELIQGCRVVLKTPAQQELLTTLVTYGVSMQQLDNGDFAIPAEPTIELTVDVGDIDIPIGTEVWVGYTLQ